MFTKASPPLATADCAAPGDDLRCLCGQLVARLVEGGVELKCRRCRRLVVVPLTGDDAAAAVATGTDSPSSSARGLGGETSSTSSKLA